MELDAFGYKEVVKVVRFVKKIGIAAYWENWNRN
jgi:hypothetical protein